MQQGDVIRVLTSLAVAGAGAGLALAGASLTGNLGGATTIERIVPSTAKGAAAKSSSVGTGSALSVEQIYRLDAPGVVRITAAGGGSTAATLTTAAPARALGSGFVIDKAGHIVTNNHVVGGAQTVWVSFSGNDEMSARVLGEDPSTDVAVLQVDAHSRSLAPLPLGDSDTVQVGDPVVAIGNPLDLTRTATAGIVSAVQRTIDSAPGAAAVAHTIQTDAAINHGNTGGPLINSRGEVIGVNAPITGDTAGGSVGVGFAIPIDTVKTVVAQLIHGGKVEHAYLGIGAVPVTPTLARTYNLPVSHGLLVQDVTVRSAAAAAGVRTGTNTVVVAGESYRLGGDIIVRADGRPVSTGPQLRAVLETMKPGDRLALVIWRGDRRRTVQVTLGRPPG